MNAVEVPRAAVEDLVDAEPVPSGPPPDGPPEPAAGAPPASASPGPAAARTARTTVATRGRRPTPLKIAVGAVAYLALLALAFTLGMRQRSAADQQLYAQYHPTQVSSGGGGGQTSSLVSAALSLGEPPGSAAGAAPATTGQGGPAAGNGGQATTPNTGQATIPNAGQATTPGTGQGALSGRLTAVTASSLTIQSRQGNAQRIATGATTRYYLAAATSRSALAVGLRVAIATGAGTAGTAVAEAVTILPAGGPTIALRPPGQAIGARSSLAGTIVALQPGSMSVRTTQGGTQQVTLAGTTAVYRLEPAVRGRLHAGQTVAASETTADGQDVAGTVVGTDLAGVSLRLLAP